MDKKLFNKEFYFNVDFTKSGRQNKDFFVEGYAATTDLDRQGDIIVMKALEEAAPKLIANGHTVFFNHDYNRCIGRLDSVSVDEKGLKVHIYVSEWEEELRKKIEEGIINKFSIGGRVLAGERLTPSEAVRQYPDIKAKPAHPVNVIQKMELFEVSIVGLPANASAEFMHKSLSQALKDIPLEEHIEKIDNLGQIPDKTTTEVLPKEVITEKKTVEEPKMEEVIKQEEVIAAPAVTVDVVPAVTEEVKIAPVTEVVKQEEQAIVTEDQSKRVVTEKEQSTTITTTEQTPEGAFKATQEVVAETVTETVDGQVKVTETNQVIQVRTYTVEEVKAIQADYQKQIEDKDAMINSLKAEVEQVRLEKAESNVAPLSEQMSQVMKSIEELKTKVSELPTMPEGKTTRLVVKDDPLKIKNAVLTPANPETAFLTIFKGRK
jgi:HK97 family phage prohead protease